MESMLRQWQAVGIVGAAILAGSCGGNGGEMVDPPVQEASIQATVTLDGAPASGVTVRLFAAAGGAALATMQTGTAGAAVFGGLEAGAYEVEVEPPSDAEVTDGAPRRAVTASAGSTATVSFALATPGAPQAVEILLTGNLTFSPDDVTIEVGQTVVWRNEVAMLHTVTPDGHGEWQEATLSEQGETFSHTFTTVGTFPYFCVPHRADAMTGVIEVQ